MEICVMYVVYVFMRDIFDVIKLMVNDVSLCSMYHATANDVNEVSRYAVA